MFTKSINDYLIWGILTVHHSKVMHWQPAVFTVLMNWLLGRFVSVSKQVKIESRKTQSDEESPRNEVSENNFRFDESTMP